MILRELKYEDVNKKLISKNIYKGDFLNYCKFYYYIVNCWLKKININK